MINSALFSGLARVLVGGATRGVGGGGEGPPTKGGRGNDHIYLQIYLKIAVIYHIFTSKVAVLTSKSALFYLKK